MRKLCWICLVLLMSCELIVDVKVPYEGDKIVLNAIQGPSGPWTVELTMSRYILDKRQDRSPYDPITIAEVTIYEEDGTSNRLPHGALGYYYIEKFPEEGRKYRIVARANGFSDIDAEMTVPKTVKIIDAEWDSTGIDRNPPPPGQSPPFIPAFNIPLSVTFADPPGIKNYYSILVYTHFVNTYTNDQTQEVQHDSATAVTRTWITDPAIGNEEDRKMRFSDNAFEGSTYTAKVIAQSQLRESSAVDIYRVEVVLVSLSEEYFRYEESRELYFQNNGDPFAQPIQTFSNVNNGLGIFAGYTNDKITWDR
ncbi:MAG TPA: DUF4249 domain-containing protein [Cyclobacteriaceae bacterium]|nr:DUF4249 domain-containing protein [Cyclobacteriaceae bacterium]